MEIALIALSVISVSLLVGLISATRKIKAISEGFSALYMTYNAMKEMLDSKETVTKEEDDIHKENFIKFLSDSREWAFGYIEEVQTGLKKFIDGVEPEIEYFNAYGSAIEGMVPPHEKALKKISQEFTELKKLLPEDSNDGR